MHLQLFCANISDPNFSTGPVDSTLKLLWLFYVSMKDLTMSPLSDESIGIIFGRNWVKRKISMKMLAQKLCKCTFAGNLEKNHTGGIT